MRIRHLVVINVNDAYGNLYVEGMRNARDGYAPDMTIQQIPLDEGSGSINGAVGAAKDTGYRFIFAIVFTAETHDQLMHAAYEQGIAGDGKHNWIFGDSFLGTLDNRSFEKNSPLHLSYRYAIRIIYIINFIVAKNYSSRGCHAHTISFSSLLLSLSTVGSVSWKSREGSLEFQSTTSMWTGCNNLKILPI